MKKKTATVKRIFILSIILIIVSSLFLLGIESGDTTVYVTNSGKKYHREECGSLSRSKIAVSLDDALHSGYEPCGVCNPPARSTSRPVLSITQKPVPPGELYRVNKENLANFKEGEISRMVPAEVVGHIDGDTVRVRISSPPPNLNVVETIRMIGVDTPETVHPHKPVEYFGKEASDYTKEQLLGKQVYLAFDWNLRDQYDRLLAYIYTGDNQCFNALLVQEGYGHAYITYPFQFKDAFKALERTAQKDKRGLWR